MPPNPRCASSHSARETHQRGELLQQNQIDATRFPNRKSFVSSPLIPGTASSAKRGYNRYSSTKRCTKKPEPLTTASLSLSRNLINSDYSASYFFPGFELFWGGGGGGPRDLVFKVRLERARTTRKRLIIETTVAAVGTDDDPSPGGQSMACWAILNKFKAAHRPRRWKAGPNLFHDLLKTGLFNGLPGSLDPISHGCNYARWEVWRVEHCGLGWWNFEGKQFFWWIRTEDGWLMITLIFVTTIKATLADSVTAAAAALLTLIILLERREICTEL